MNHDQFKEQCKRSLAPVIQGIQNNGASVMFDADQVAYLVVAEPTIQNCYMPPLTIPPGPWRMPLLMMDKAGVAHIMEKTAQEGIDEWGDDYQLVTLQLALAQSANSIAQPLQVAVLLKEFQVLGIPDSKPASDTDGWNLADEIIKAIQSNSNSVWDDATSKMHRVAAVGTHGSKELIAFFDQKIFTMNELYLDLNGLPRRTAGAKGRYFNTKVRSLDAEIAAFNAKKTSNDVVIVMRFGDTITAKTVPTNRW